MTGPAIDRLILIAEGLLVFWAIAVFIWFWAALP